MKRLLLFITLFLLTNYTNAQGWGQIQKIVSNDRAIGDHFGYALTINGDYAAIGARFDDLDSGDMGSVYIYKKDNENNWIEHQKIFAPDKKQSDHFGWSVGIHNDYLVVGARGQDFDVNDANFFSSAGAAYIFEKDGSDTWNYVQKLVAPERAFEDVFGESVAISGNYAIIAAPWEDDDANEMNPLAFAGSAYIFEKDGSGVWNFEQKITASVRMSNDRFGRDGSLSISGNTIVVGSFAHSFDANDQNEIPSTGGVYIFERDTNGDWNQTQKLVASDREQGEWFGRSVSLDGNMLVVGASQEYPTGNSDAQYGAIYIFEKDGSGVWTEVQKIRPSYLQHQLKFGQSVSIDDNHIIVGAHRANIGIVPDGGAVFMFEKDGSGVWNEIAVMYDPSASNSDNFGIDVAISGDNAIVGAFQEDEDEMGMNTLGEAGSAYIFNINEPNNLNPLLSVVESNFDFEMMVYPNPVKSTVHFNLQTEYNSIKISIVNLIGQEVFSQTYHSISEVMVNLNNIQNGLYLVNLNIDNLNRQTIKIIKE